ncbi:MAG: MFS transporter [Bacteriovoracaceae bacterium]|nr:MFS transporter [Bacteriovoracaceae bacterium]
MTLIKKVPIVSENELKYILLLAAVQFAHMVDFVVLMPLGPTLMQDLSITPAQFGTLVSSYNFSAAIAGILFGSFADKFDRKFLLIMALIGFTLGTFSCAIASDFPLLITARVVTGAFGGMLNGLIFAIISDIVPFERRGKAMGVVMSSFSVASVVGVPIGLAISDFSHWKYTFVFIGTFSVLIIILAQLIFPNITDHLGKNAESFFARLKGLVAFPNYRLSFMFIFLVSGSMFLLIPFLSPFAVKNMGIATTNLKYMYLVGGIFTIITARIFGVLTDKVGAIKLFTIIVLVSFVPITLYTHAGIISFVTYLALGSFFMTMVSGRMIPCMTLISQVPNSNDRGLFMSVLNSVRAMGSGTATFFGGLIISESALGNLVGFDTAGFLSVGVGLLTVLLAILISRNLKSPA